jgi:hypothetical protein
MALLGGVTGWVDAGSGGATTSIRSPPSQRLFPAEVG